MIKLIYFKKIIRGVIPYAITSIIFLIGSTCTLAAKGVIVNGIFTVTVYNGASDVIAGLGSTNDYKVSLTDDGRWAIEVRPRHGEGDPMLSKEDSIWMTYDGTNTYYAHYNEAVLGLTNGAVAITAITPIKNQASIAYISSGNYPFVQFEEHKRPNILWLMYGAGQLFHDNPDTTLPLPWVPARWNLLSYGFSTESEISLTSPFLPHSIRFVRNSKLDLKNEDAEMNRPELDAPSGETWIADWRKQLKSRKDEWLDGMLAGELKTKGYTNVNGIEVPTSFSCATYLPTVRKTTFLRCLYEGNVTGISDLPESESFLPPILASLKVADSRFHYNDANRKIDQINYGLGIVEPWPSQNSPKLQAIFNSLLGSPQHSARYQSGQIRRKRVLITAIILFTALVFPLLLYRQVRKQP